MDPAAALNCSAVWLLPALLIVACADDPTQPSVRESLEAGPAAIALEAEPSNNSGVNAADFLIWQRSYPGAVGDAPATFASNFIIHGDGSASGRIAIRSSSDDQLLRIEAGEILCEGGGVAGLVISGVRLSDGERFWGDIVPADAGRLIVPPEPIQPIEECLIFDLTTPGPAPPKKVEVEGMLIMSPDLCAIR